MKHHSKILSVWVMLMYTCVLFISSYAGTYTLQGQHFADEEKGYTLTVTYSCEDKVFTDQSVTLYRIAGQTVTGLFMPSEEYASLQEQMKDIGTQEKSLELKNRVDEITAQTSPEAYRSENTSADGSVVFGGLNSGLYLVEKKTIADGNEVYDFDSVLVAVPYENSDGILITDIDCIPKCDIRSIPAKETSHTITKIWNDSGYEKIRPTEVYAEIYCNDTLYKQVALNAANSWTYTWSSTETDAVWKVYEKNVPASYTCSISTDGDSFIIKNTYVPSTPSSQPQTGDTSNAILWISMIVGSIAGIGAVTGFIVVSIHSKQKTERN